MNVQIAQRLAELRRAKGYSQEALANELGLSRQAVSKWERAESSPDTENLIALAHLYGVSLDDLLSVDKEIEDDVAFENAERAEQAGAEQASRAADREAAAQAVAAATQASQAAARAAEAATQASTQATRATDDARRARTKGPWRSFPYGVLMIPLWFILTLAGAAPYSFLVFFTIPVYHWLANILDGALARDAEDVPPVATKGAGEGTGDRPADPRDPEGRR